MSHLQLAYWANLRSSPLSRAYSSCTTYTVWCTSGAHPTPRTTLAVVWLGELNKGWPYLNRRSPAPLVQLPWEVTTGFPRLISPSEGDLSKRLVMYLPQKVLAIIQAIGDLSFGGSTLRAPPLTAPQAQPPLFKDLISLIGRPRWTFRLHMIQALDLLLSRSAQSGLRQDAQIPNH